MKTWNLGNTTVRNPERIRDALRVFKDRFEGQTFDKPTQNAFFNALIEEEVVKGDPSQPGSRDLSGRKWASAFNKLGLALPRGTKANPVVTITEAGNSLLSEEALESDIFLRQMLKVQLPSPTEANLEDALIHPFYLVLSVGVALEEQGMKGITKEEIALFLQSATNNNQCNQIVESIRHYRYKRDEIKGRVGKRGYFLEHLTLKAKELYGNGYTKQKAETLNDYSDTTVRYSAITGVFGIGRQSLVIKEDQLNLAKAIVESGPPKILSDSEFFQIFHNPSLPSLPTDDVSFLASDISALAKRLDELSKETGSSVESRAAVADTNILHLKRRRVDLEQELVDKKEIQFYRSQNESTQVKDIMNTFESIINRETIGGSDYRPAWAEWNVWRVFLSINTISNPISETRGFKINSELFPVHHAKGGAADLCFEYEDGTILPTEITLSSNERQFNMEGEAVKFHVKSVVEKNQSKEVIGLFTAPDVHVATAHEFFRADFYSQKLGEAINLDIVPLNFEQLQSLLPGQRNGCGTGEILLQKLRDLLELKKESTNGPEWLEKINVALA